MVMKWFQDTLIPDVLRKGLHQSGKSYQWRVSILFVLKKLPLENYKEYDVIYNTI